MNNVNFQKHDPPTNAGKPPHRNSGLFHGLTRGSWSWVLTGLLAAAAPLVARGTSPIVGVSAWDALEGPGKHVVTQGKYLHVVYKSNGKIWYVSSGDGLSWTAPVLLSTGVSNPQEPTIGIDAHNNLGVAFWTGASLNSSIYYTYKDTSQSTPTWSAPQKLYSGNSSLLFAKHPAIVGFRNEMHLAFSDFWVEYMKFPTTAPPTSINPAVVETVYDDQMCACGSGASAPVIAIAPSDVCDKSDPTIMIGFEFDEEWSDTNLSCTPQAICTAGVRLFKKTSSWWQQELEDSKWKSVPARPNCSGSPPNVFTSLYGLALTANRRNREFYFGYGYRWDIYGQNTVVAKLIKIPENGTPTTAGGALAPMDLTAPNNNSTHRYKLAWGWGANSIYDEENWSGPTPASTPCPPPSGLPGWEKAEAIYYSKYLGNGYRWVANLVFVYQDAQGNFQLATDGFIASASSVPGYCPLPYEYFDSWNCDWPVARLNGAQREAAGASHILNFTLSNAAPATLTNCVATFEIPQHVTLANVTPSQGSWSNDSGTVTCTLGNLGTNAVASIDFEIRAFVVGPLTNAVTVTANGYDDDRPIVASAVTTIDPSAITRPGWASLTNSTPPARGYAAMAEDSTRAQIILFGGTPDGNQALGDTWDWEGPGFGWRQVALTGPNPGPRFLHAMAQWSDFASSHVLLFGGQDSDGNQFSDTWQWDGPGMAWHRASTNGPSARVLLAMASEPNSQRVVLFGGYNPTEGLKSDTWEWVGSGAFWTQLAATGPSARAGHAMAYDPIRGKVVLFGGQDATGYRGDTWEWDGPGGHWTLVASNGPAARRDHAMASRGNKIVLFGGVSQSGQELNDTWEWDGLGGSWVQTSEGCPAARFAHSMASDPVTGGVLLYGGGTSVAVFDDSWLYNGSIIIANPTNVAANLGHPASFSVAVDAQIDTHSYQWEQDRSGTFEAIPGATNSTYTIATVTTNHVCRYRCIVNVAGCASMSQAAGLTILAPPAWILDPITIGPTQMIIHWTGPAGGALESSTSLFGPWTTVSGQTNNTAMLPPPSSSGLPRQFFRVRSN
jgi:hypothetical protein